jgi:hypothetical protein
MVPEEQQTCWPGCSLEQNSLSELYLVKPAPDMPHLVCSVGQALKILTYIQACV